MPQVSVRPAPAPQQPPAASLSEPHSYPPAVPAATGQLSLSNEATRRGCTHRVRPRRVVCASGTTGSPTTSSSSPSEGARQPRPGLAAAASGTAADLSARCAQLPREARGRAHCDRARPRAPGAVTAPNRNRRHATQTPRLRRPRLTQSRSARSRRYRCRRAAATAPRRPATRAGRACVVLSRLKKFGDFARFNILGTSRDVSL